MSGTLKLTLAYDGTGFRGSQRQKNGRSVQEDLEAALFRLNGRALNVHFAGRTDSGVHAVGQVLSCEDARPELSDERMVQAINAHLADDLAITRCERRNETFHARFDATWREYRYRIWCGIPQPLLRDRVWVQPSALDIVAMAEGANALYGPVDLASFAGKGVGVPGGKTLPGERGTVRTIRHCSVRAIGPWWGIAPGSGFGVELRIIADGFLPHSVRTISGALAEIGRGRQPADWIQQLIQLADRRYGPQTAPPHGLVLWRVGYGSDVPGPGTDGELSMGEDVIHRAHG